MQPIYGASRRLYRFAIEPTMLRPDERRRALILNVLLIGLIFITSLALLGSILTFIGHQNTNGAQSISITAIVTAVLLLAHRTIRNGKIELVSYGLIGGMGLIVLELMLHWSFELPQVLLVSCLTIVVASVLLTARAGLVFSGCLALLILVCGFAQVGHYLPTDTSWRQVPFVLIDAIGYALILCIIGVVSWLSNREISHSLQLAYQSEQALLAERDSLEVKVIERTKELEQLQMLRELELQRYATFGKLSAGLIHELSGPLMAAGMHLEQATKTTSKNTLIQVSQNLQHLERYLEAARKQLRDGGTLSHFLVKDEVHEVLSIIRPLAAKRQLRIQILTLEKARLYGDPIKFGQLLNNILMNALEAYDATIPSPRRVIRVRVTVQKRGLKIIVNYRGVGITEEQMAHIFEPFYTSKPLPETHVGMGIGLSLVKQFVEQDFRGRLTIRSSARAGTTVTVVLHDAARRHDS